MTDDIVTRLRGVLNAFTVEEQQDIIDDAAAEIERLRAAGDALLAALATETLGGSMAVWEGTNEALDAWQEARRD